MGAVTDDTPESSGATQLAGRLPAGWEVWSHERRGPVVLAYRPDVFDAESYPAACLPTISVKTGSRRPGAGGGWQVTLYFEPAVDCGTDKYGTRAAALDGAVSLASSVVAGEIDPREVYQVPRPAYLDKLDELLELAE